MSQKAKWLTRQRYFFKKNYFFGFFLKDYYCSNCDYGSDVLLQKCPNCGKEMQDKPAELIKFNKKSSK